MFLANALQTEELVLETLNGVSKNAIKNFNRGRAKVKNVKITYWGDEKPITIWTSLDNVTVIQFEKDEAITYITTGFNEGWNIVPNSNFIFLQPKAVRSNLMFEKEIINFALMTKEYNDFLKKKNLFVDPKEQEAQKAALEKEKKAKEQEAQQKKAEKQKQREQRRADLRQLTSNDSQNAQFNNMLKQQRNMELDQMERLEDMQEQANAQAMKQIEALKKSQSQTLTQRTKEKISVNNEKQDQNKTPEDNFIDLVPSDSAWKTNLVVRTNKALYQFILRIAQQDNFAQAYLSVKLEYPQRQKVSSAIEEELKKREEEERQKALILQENRNITAYINNVMAAGSRQIINQEKIREQKQQIVLDQAKALETQYVKKALERNPIPRNYDYVVAPEKHSKNIMPSEIFDDGKFTYFGFKNNTLQPAIFVALDNKKGSRKESMVDAAIESNMTNSGLRWYRVNEVAEKFYLRKDKALVTVLNKGYGKNPLPRDYNINNYGELKRVIKRLPAVRDK
ncbi:conjugal transfer protein [Helicobacter pylori GAM96Ai]|nr:conjugal transfer protein [Helicobacter pylori GAM96Ai]